MTQAKDSDKLIQNDRSDPKKMRVVHRPSIATRTSTLSPQDQPLVEIEGDSTFDPSNLSRTWSWYKSDRL